MLSWGQVNLVPKPSFEDAHPCPGVGGNLGWVTHWFATGENNTPDYYSACSIVSGGSVPQNVTGFQEAFDGDSYIGLYTFGISVPDLAREAITVELNATLIANNKYVFKMYYSLADIMEYSTQTLGFMLSDGPLVESVPIIAYEPTYYNPELVYDDSLNWRLFRDTITAIGNERYLTIANFFPDSLSDTTYLGPMDPIWDARNAYYYIDDVSLIPLDSLLSVHDVGKAEIVSVYPNPSDGVFTVDLPNCQGQKAAYRLSVSDVTGKTVFNSRIACGQRTLNLGNLDNGTYLLRVLSADNSERWHYKLLLMH